MPNPATRNSTELDSTVRRARSESSTAAHSTTPNINSNTGVIAPSVASRGPRRSPGRGWRRGAADAHSALTRRPAVRFTRGLQPDLHPARHDDDLLVRLADPLRLRELPHPDADRRAGHGVPPAQRLQLLDVSALGP